MVKVGSQSLLQATGKLDCDFMADLVRQIAALKKQGHTVYFISSGAVAAGRGIWQNPKKLSETAARQIFAGLGQVELMQIYRQLAAQHKLHAVQLLLTKTDFISRSHYLNVERLLLSLQDFPQLLPVINENDSVAVEELIFTDNDQLAGVLSQQLGADLLLLLTEAQGIYDKNPQETGAKLLPLLGSDSGVNWPELQGKSHSGRGGISSKLETARKMSRVGVLTNIAAARQSEIVLRVVAAAERFIAIQNDASVAKSQIKIAQQKWREEWIAKPQLGTLVLPSCETKMPETKKNLRGVRKWLSARNLAAGHARIIVNEGLAQKLKNGGQAISILPVGIISYEGEFSKGDLIDIYSLEQPIKLGIGLARYGHLQLKKILCQKNQAIFIHYNYLHIEKWAIEALEAQTKPCSDMEK